MQSILFWLIRPRFGIFSFVCILIALSLPTVLGLLLAAGAIFLETLVQNAYKQIILSNIRKNHRYF